MKEEITSEFGKGTIYPLLLWACHLERNKYKEKYDYSMWFNGASDHLYELEIPKKWKNKPLGRKLKKLIDLAFDIGHGDRMLDEEEAIKKDFKKCVILTKEIAFLIDKELGFNPIKGEYE
jgi:esterase/lipase superfamily enzyme